MAVIASLPRAGTWDRLVATELATVRMASPEAPSGIVSPLLVFATSETSDVATDLGAQTFDVAPTLGDDEKRRWFTALCDDAERLFESDDISTLEKFWQTLKCAPRERRDEDASLPAEARELFTALALVRHAWPKTDIAALGGDRDKLRALVTSGSVEIEHGWISISPAGEQRAIEAASLASEDTCQRVASALSRQWPADPWAQARAAELQLLANDVSGADKAHSDALARLPDALARRDVIARWMKAVDSLHQEDAQLMLRVSAAERALTAGEAEEALRWAKNAAASAPENWPVALLFGRAAAATGDLVTARVAFQRAMTLASNAGEELAPILVELADVAHLSGDLETAARDANLALGTRSAALQLRARNILGKIYLAKSQWDEAERHFAEDACSAARIGDTGAELRARINRGIALMSKGMYDEARSILESVREEAERLGEVKMAGFAYINLAVVAMWRHDYGAALKYSEAGLKFGQRVGDRLRTAQVLGNLAELRYKLGLFEHAEHAVVFGRRTIAPGMSPDVTTRLSINAARLALERGNTAEARREILRAISDGERAGDRNLLLGWAYRSAVRIALEDGDLASARHALQKADELAVMGDARTEVAFLRALIARAEGKFEIHLALEALTLAREAGEEELLRDIHVLLAEHYRTEKMFALARTHVEQAIVLRDQVAQGLEGEVRAAFLRRKDVANLAPMLENIVDLEKTLRALAAAEGSYEELPPTVRFGRSRASASGPPDTGRAALGEESVRGRLSTLVRPQRHMVGEDPAMVALQGAIKKVARSESTVLIRGESGTGKELVAEALHRASLRVNGPLVTVNCAALVETLLLSELFGHEKGAFTGAVARRRGRFELAEGGTLFLDEIGDISPRTQVALLRVLQERTFERVGGTTPIHANVRIVCATHRDLRAMVERGEFREDLYYRLRGITLEVPPLRARLGDIPRIGDSLLERIASERGEPRKKLSEQALQLLMRHRWPGNVRELENALRAASLFAEGAVIQLEDLLENVDDLRAAATTPPESPRAAPVSSKPMFSSDGDSSLQDIDDSLHTITDSDDSSGDGDTGGSTEETLADFEQTGNLPPDETGATTVAYACIKQGALSLPDLKRQIERDCIARALEETRGNITRAASLLGMKRPRLSQLVKQYGLLAASEGSL
ncbi:sigma 54-interacting transcriptional regulator [Pendulispora albinea]|uniref:Sigma 54-interacting transcriptional regulator n=1 Tax=Pendulispora albinea TaxID=2741071 RepID=A0ABZ2M4V1_9BACT